MRVAKRPLSSNACSVLVKVAGSGWLAMASSSARCAGSATFEVALPAHLAELDAIASQPEPATFTNTLQAFDESGRLATRIELLFHNLTASETSPELQAVEREMAPRQAAHENAIYMNAKLFARIDDLYTRRAALDLNAEQLRLLERVHLDFVRAGAKLPPDARTKSRCTRSNRRSCSAFR